MKVLVVGGTGVVGAAVLQSLAQQNVPTAVLAREPGEGEDRISGDVTLPDLGLNPDVRRQLRQDVTHVVTCFGSVEFEMGPRTALRLHRDGAKNVLALYEELDNPSMLVHVSSILISGGYPRWFGNEEFDIGQRLRSWYEYGKFEAEAAIREATSRIPARIVRLGPVLGADGPVLPSFSSGLTATLPYLLKQLPVFLRDRGTFPCYVADSLTAASVLLDVLFTADDRVTYTYFDPTLPTLNQTLTALCSAWNVVPRIVAGSSPMHHLSELIGPKLGLPKGVSQYLEPWAYLDPGLLRELPCSVAAGPRDFINRTSAQLRLKNQELMPG